MTLPENYAAIRSWVSVEDRRGVLPVLRHEFDGKVTANVNGRREMTNTLRELHYG